MAAVAAILGLAWLLDLLVLQTSVLTAFRGRPPLTPIYGFWWPLLRPQLLVFAGLAAAAVVLAGRVCDTKRTARIPFLAFLTAASLLLPPALFWVRQEPVELGTQFQIYPGEEFIYDAQKIESIPVFLRNYTVMMPELSLHGKHFPPGHAILLYLVSRVSPGSAAAGAAVLAAFALALLFAYFAMAQVVAESSARQGALLLLACPSMIDFACTSMDAVFLCYVTLALWLGLRSFRTEARPTDAVLAGLAFFVAAFASFSALPAGFVVALYGATCWRQMKWKAIRQLGLIGAGFAIAGAALSLGTGFSLWACFETARHQNVVFMTRVIGRNPEAFYGKISYGNLAAFMIGCGLALAGGLWLRIRSNGSMDRWTGAAAVALAVMTFGGFYLMETERIWLYAVPWVALAAVSGRSFPTPSLRILLGAGFAQALAMEILVFTLW